MSGKTIEEVVGEAVAAERTRIVAQMRSCAAHLDKRRPWSHAGAGLRAVATLIEEEALGTSPIADTVPPGGDA